MQAKRKENRLLMVSVCFAIACPLEINSLIRYVRQLPGDWLGIALYVVGIVGFALIAVGCYVEWARRGGNARSQEASHPGGNLGRVGRELRHGQPRRAQPLQGKRCRAS
jgi:hypothetical protein